MSAHRKQRVYTLDGDTVTVEFTYNAESDMFFGDYPDFAETPRFTPQGRRWVNVTDDSCIFADGEYDDCGSCRFFRAERAGDLIGICENEAANRRPTE